MKTLLQIMVLVVGGLLVLTGCQVEEVILSAPVEHEISPSDTPETMSEVEIQENETQSRITSNFLFYDSFATW